MARAERNRRRIVATAATSHADEEFDRTPVPLPFTLRRIAIIAHDAKKVDMLEFVREHVAFFRTQPLIATGNTGGLLAEALELSVERVAHGPYGGDLMIGSLVAQDKIEAVLFFRDPLTAQPHEPDVAALMRVCDVHEVPLATNLATAYALVAALKLMVTAGVAGYE